MPRTKRERPPPSKSTPHKPSNYRSVSKSVSKCLELSSDEAPSDPILKPSDWTDEELMFLVEYLLFYEVGDTWPTHKGPAFWDECSKYMLSRCQSTCRSG